MKMIIPEDCLHYDVCKWANDAGCLDGCDFRLEKTKSDNTSSNSDYPKCTRECMDNQKCHAYNNGECMNAFTC